jgi:hypothetical protein
LSLEFDKPRSNRESWWRSGLKETPKPGTYNLPSFTQELNKRRSSFSFKTDGRRRDPMPHLRKGQYLLPGAYTYEDLYEK